MKCVIIGEDTDLEERIRAFISNRDSEMVAGRRRMGKGALISLVLKIASEEGLVCGCTEDAPPDADLVIIEDWMAADFGSISEKWPESDILYAQDLCHHVPAVARVKDTDCISGTYEK